MSTNEIRPCARVLPLAMAALAALRPAALHAQPLPLRAEPPPRSVSLERARLEKIRIEGRVRAWEIDKLCIDGQAYLVVVGPSGPSGIGASFKDGKPEPCVAKPEPAR